MKNIFVRGPLGATPPPPLGILCHYVLLIEGVQGHSQKKLCTKILALEGL